MATYFLINCVFVLVTFVLLRVTWRRPTRTWWMMLIALVVLTAVFDSLLVLLSFIDYAPDKISGIRIGAAPIEDFFYAIYAAIIVPLLWQRFGRKKS